MDYAHTWTILSRHTWYNGVNISREAFTRDVITHNDTLKSPGPNERGKTQNTSIPIYVIFGFNMNATSYLESSPSPQSYKFLPDVVETLLEVGHPR